MQIFTSILKNNGQSDETDMVIKVIDVSDVVFSTKKDSKDVTDL